MIEERKKEPCKKPEIRGLTETQMPVGILISTTKAIGNLKISKWTENAMRKLLIRLDLTKRQERIRSEATETFPTAPTEIENCKLDKCKKQKKKLIESRGRS